MKPDLEYVKRMLEIVEEHPKTFFDLDTFEKAGLEVNEQEFLFHLLYLRDEGLFRGAAGDEDVGVTVTADGQVIFSSVPLWLTSSGHTFADALRQPQVFEKLQTAVQEVGMGAVTQAAAALLGAFARGELGLSGS